jgi:hypothetical protein
MKTRDKSGAVPDVPDKKRKGGMGDGGVPSGAKIPQPNGEEVDELW